VKKIPSVCSYKIVLLKKSYILNHEQYTIKNTSDTMKQNVWATTTRFDPCSRDHHQAEYEKEYIKKTHAHLIFMVTENYLCPRKLHVYMKRNSLVDRW